MKKQCWRVGGSLGCASKDRFCKVKLRLTQRAADGGYAARFLSFFLALGFSRFGGESTLSPTAANANRWAAKYH
jgi:hypothetical protein